jgi:hypothetical protein
VTTVTRVFRSLGSEPTRREVALTAKAIRDSADLELFEEFGMTVPSGIVGSGEPTFDRVVVDRLVAAAARVGVGPYVALDLYTAVTNPDWAPFHRRVFDAEDLPRPRGRHDRRGRAV